MDQYKNSLQPFVQQQQVYVIEDKLTLTRRWEGLPGWLRVNSLVSANLRQTVSEGKSRVAPTTAAIVPMPWRRLGILAPVA